MHWNLLLDFPVFITLKTSSSPTAFTLGRGTSHFPLQKRKEKEETSVQLIF